MAQLLARLAFLFLDFVPGYGWQFIYLFNFDNPLSQCTPGSGLLSKGSWIKSNV